MLATSDKARSPFLPDIPTFKEAGYDIQGTRLVRPVRAGQDAGRNGRAPEQGHRGRGRRPPQIKERLLTFGLVPTGTSAAELARIQKADSELWAPAVKASGFTPEQ